MPSFALRAPWITAALAIAAGFWATGTGTAHAEGVTFAKPVAYDVGSNPLGLAAGDLNRDGRLDLVTADNNGGSVSVLLGSGQGTFTHRGPYAVGDSGPGSVAIGDFTGDGKPDVAELSLSNPKQIAIVPGDGYGALGPVSPHSPALNNYGLALASADLNHDGHPDLVSASEAPSGNIEVFLSNGDGTFKAKPALTIQSPTSLAVADVNGDGRPDIVAGTYSGLVSLLGVGDGTFGATHGYDQSLSVGAVTLGDFNDDGHQDVALATNQGTLAVGVALGGGTGAFGAPVLNSVAVKYSQIGAADMFSNGRLDPVAASYDAHKLSVFFSNGDGTIGCCIEDTTVNTPRDTMTADFNNDGNPDVAVADGTDSKVLVYLSTPPRASLGVKHVSFAHRQLESPAATKTLSLTDSESLMAALPDVRVGRLRLSGPAAKDFTASGCSSPVIGGASCKLRLAFRPTAVGRRAATLTITDNAAGRTQTVSLVGIGSPPCSARPSSLTPAALASRRLAVSVQCSRAATLKLQLVASAHGNRAISRTSLHLAKPASRAASIALSRTFTRLVANNSKPLVTLKIAELVAGHAVYSGVMQVVVKR